MADRTDAFPSPTWREGLGERAPGAAGQAELAGSTKTHREARFSIAYGGLLTQELSEGFAALSPGPSPQEGEGSITCWPLDMRKGGSAAGGPGHKVWYFHG